MVRAFLNILLLSSVAFQSFRKDERIVGAYYFPCEEGISHRRELGEMARVGIDIALVVFTGEKRAVEAVQSMVRALETLEKEQPKLAICLDAADPAPAVRLFEANVPARFRATVEGRPLVWLTKTREGAGRADDVFDGRAAYVVAEASRNGTAPDRRYVAGAARTGLQDASAVTVGPGIGKERDDGKFYARSWLIAQRIETRLVVIDSWNGLRDGTEVCETPVQQRKYVESTKDLIRSFKQGERMASAKGKWTGAKKALYTLKYNPHDQGLRPVAADDGLFDTVELAGIAMVTTRENGLGPRRHLYFDVDDSFCFFDRKSFDVTVEFLDTGRGSFSLEYDCGDRTLQASGRAYRPAGETGFGGTGDWRSHTFSLQDASFGNAQKGGADFRLVVEKRGLAVRRVAVTPK